MPRRKPQIEAERYEDRQGTYYDIHFPGSGQRVAVLAYSLNHWETKDFFFNASKVAPTLLGLDGKVISAKGRKFRVRTGRYVPIEGECLPSECPNFHLMAKRVDPHEGMPTLAEILEKENKRLAKIRKKNQEKYARFIGGGKSVVKNAAPKGRRSRRKAVRRKKTAE